MLWLAGLFEGEGHVGVSRHGGRDGTAPTIQLQIGSTDLDVVERCLRVTGCGSVGGPYNAKGRGKPFYKWQVYQKRDIARILLAIYPELAERRRAQVEVVLPYLHYTKWLKKVQSA